MQSHLDNDLFGSLDDRMKLLEEQAKIEKEHNQMVFSALSNPSGDKLIDYLEDYLKKPSYIHGSTVEHMHIIEGSKMFVRDLLSAYTQGKGN